MNFVKLEMLIKKIALCVNFITNIVLSFKILNRNRKFLLTFIETKKIKNIYEQLNTSQNILKII